MIFHRCDICGKEIQNQDGFTIETFVIETNIGLQGHYEFGFEDVCQECTKKIRSIDSDDFKEFFVEKFIRQ